MSFNLPNVSLLGLTQNSRFFGAGFQYSSLKNLAIEGLVIDLTEAAGITGVWNGSEGVIATIANNNKNYQELVLNGISFGSGRLNNISLQAGVDVRTKKYTANISIQDSGNLFNFTGIYYSGVDISNFQYLNNFSESYAFDKKSNGGYSYRHDARIQFSSGVGQLNAVNAAQSLARTLFTGSNLGLSFYPQYTNKQGKRYISESYSLIDNSCGFQETFNFDHDNGNYSAIHAISTKLDTNGIVEATEQASIAGIENPNYQKALSAIGIEMTGSYLRCSGVTNNYFPSAVILSKAAVSQGRTVDLFNNKIGYSITYNNSPSNISPYFWDYTLQISKQDVISVATENGSIIGRGENTTASFQNAQNGLNIVRAGISARCSALFVSPYLPATNFLQVKQESFSPIQGAATYSYSYSNDPALIANAGIRRRVSSKSEQKAVYKYNKIRIIGVREIIQDDQQSTQGANTVIVNMEGDKTVGLNDFLSSATSSFSSAVQGSDGYVGDASYSYNPNENSCSAQLTWVYNVAAAQSPYP